MPFNSVFLCFIKLLWLYFKLPVFISLWHLYYTVKLYIYIYMPHWPNTRTCSQYVPLDLNARLWHLFTRIRCFLTHAAQCCVWVSPSLQVPEPSSFILQGIESREIDSFSGWTGWNKRAGSPDGPTESAVFAVLHLDQPCTAEQPQNGRGALGGA